MRNGAGKSRVGALWALSLAACTASFEAPRATRPGAGDEGHPDPEAASSQGALHGRLLLAAEYQNAVADLLGPAAAQAALPPADTALHGQAAIGAGALSLGLAQLESYEKSARAVAEAALADPRARARLIPCEPLGAADAPCMAAVAATLAPRVLRRALPQGELDAWAALGAQAAQEEGRFEGGVQWMIAGLLLSPDFLYLNEVGRPHPSDPGRRLLTGEELASRLAFFLTASTPPDWLLAAAARGELEEPAQIAAAAQALLDGPRGDAAVIRVLEEVFGVAGVPAAAKDSTAFPAWSPALGGSMLAEFRALVGEAARGGRDFRALLAQPVAFVDAPLAAHYGLPAPAPGTVQRVELPPGSGRGGLLSLGGFLARHSHPVSSSPTLRGKFVRERLLCQPVDAPPANVIPSLPPDDPDKPRTTRERHAEHMSLAGCSGCHQLMDPLGFAFEHFDATGAFRAGENGLPIDATGALEGQPFDGARDLGALLAQSPRVQGCLLRAFYRQAVGRLETAGEEPFLAERQERFLALGGAIKPWLVELSASPELRSGRAAEGAPR